jgi:hypothetical protein
MARAIDVDDQRCVIRGYRFSLPCLAIDFGPDNAVLFGEPFVLIWWYGGAGS